MKKVAILQSNYIPWKGVFDMINKVDLFIFHDDLQYTKNDWRNRNKIITNKGLEWLTIPVGSSEKRLINEVVINDASWQKKHFDKIVLNYKHSKYFDDYYWLIEDFYIKNKWSSLSELNQYIIKKISKEILNIDTRFDRSENYNLELKKSDRVLELLKKAGADYYLSGPAAKNYLNEEEFKKNNIILEYMKYDYPEYEQLNGQFVSHNVTILDLIFNCGENSYKYIWNNKSKGGQ